ncbi:hypothetical protein GPJ56_009077 [Histomonas meleagridis]|uniref:uncharacterized protein n=1 Tax=Histomonas meleagridis TaxID=135588 RepID=UPI0035594C9C|nr:hypothetical protein GPJ56_009077 [Histomonas meleagridis]KAH0799266.1 hypothetical protein GO595_008063 [Histomonas meleagridis]
MNEFTELINGFNRAITPANAMLHEIEVQLTSQSFSNGLINETIKKNNLQQEISTNVQNAISAALFAKALSFGFPKKLPPKEILPQVIYGNSTLAFYFEELQRYVSSVPDFIDEYMKVLKDLISGKENDYSKIVYGIVDHIGIIQTLALATDFENRQIPSQYLIVPTIKPHLEQFSNQVLGIVKSGEAYRIASMNRQPTSELETALDTLVKTAKETIQKQIELFGDIKQKINDSFVPSYNEDAYDHFQQYAQQYSSTLASICLLSLKIGMNVPNTLHIIAQVLEKMTKFGYDMFAPILNIMRFRDKFEKSIENSKDAHENIGQIFAPLLQSLVNIQPQLLIPFQNFVNAQFVLLFQKLQKLNSEYDDEMNKLISVLRQDKKFSVFQTVGQLSQSDLSDAAKASMEVTSKILTQLLKTGSSIEEIRIKSIKERLEHPPPFGIYDKKYILGLIGTSKDVFQPTFDILKESQEILRNAHAPAQLKVGVNSITQILSLIGQLMTYIGALTIEGEIPMKSLIVFAIKDCCDDVGIKINNLKQVINDQVKVSQFGQQLITSLCEYSDALEKIEQLKPLSEQIRLMSNNIGENIVRIAIGDNTQIPTLNSIFDNILAFNQKLKPFSDKFISEVQSIGEIETKKTQEEKPKYNEFISHLPTEEETEKMFIDIMQSNNDALKTLLSKCVTSLKEDIDEFKQLFEEYNKNQNKDINEKIKMIAERIEKGKDIIKKGIEFAPKEIVEIDSLNSMIEKLKKYNNEEKSKTVPEIIMNLAEYVNKNYKEPVNSMLNNLISDILMLMKTNPSLGQTQLETFIYALKGNPEDITIEALEKLKKSKNKFEIYDFLQKALFANVIQKLMSGQSNPLNDPDSIQSKLHKYASQIDETNKEATDYFDLTQLISQFEDLVIGTDETNEMDSEMISDKLMDINSEIVSLGTEISNDLKKVTTNSMPTITTKLNNLRAKAFEILNISLVSSSKRNEVDKNITNELQEETIKLIELLNNYTNEISKVVNSSNKNSQIRNVNKINREINMCIGHISEITDEIIETPISIIESSTEDYNIISNHLMCDILKLEQLSYDNSKAKQLKFNKIHSSLNLKLQKFASNIKNITKGIDEEDNINEMVNDLQKLFGKLTTNDATTLTTEFPLKLSKVVNEIKTKVIDSLNTEITPQPKFVSHLPYRFNIPNITETPSKEIVQLKSIFDTKYNIVKSSIDKFIISLNSSKTPPEQIEKHFNEFQSSLSELIIPVSLIQTSTWNLECQNQLLKAKNSLINAGDISIESTRNRFLGNEGWRESISMFNTTIESALEQAKNVIDSTMKSIEEDLSVTNELEKELIIAACSCQSSMQRLNSLKNKAIEQKITIGDNYLGCDIIEVSTPILNNAAKLIDVAKSQTKFVSQKNPEIINQKGLINTANNLVDSLELIIIAAEATVNNEPEAMSKILAGCNLISQAVAHFLVENNQKAGSPELNVTLRKITDSVQYLIKQLRQFAEAAMDAEKNKQNTESNVTGTKRPLNNMIAKLNAEAKVVAARKALEEAEKLAKEARQGK